MVKPQVIELFSEPGQFIAVAIETALHQVYVGGTIALGYLVGDILIENFVGDGDTQQAGKIALQLVAQAAQSIGATFVVLESQLLEGAVDLFAGGGQPQSRTQAELKLFDGV